MGFSGTQHMEFVTMFVAYSGPDKGKVYGSVQWDVTFDVYNANPQKQVQPGTQKFFDVVTPDMIEGVKRWNDQSFFYWGRNAWYQKRVEHINGIVDIRPPIEYKGPPYYSYSGPFTGY
jgi:hypothetical protein